MVCIYYNPFVADLLYDFPFDIVVVLLVLASIAWQTNFTRKKKQWQQQQRLHTIYTMRATNDGQENERDISPAVYFFCFSCLSVSLFESRKEQNLKQKRQTMNDDTIMELSLCVNRYFLITSTVVFLHIKT